MKKQTKIIKINDSYFLYFDSAWANALGFISHSAASAKTK